MAPGRFRPRPCRDPLFGGEGNWLFLTRHPHFTSYANSTKQSVHFALFAKAMNWHRQLHARVSLRASSDYEPVLGLDREPALGECGDERACVTVTLWEDDRGDALGIDRLERVGNRHGRVGTR